MALRLFLFFLVVTGSFHARANEVAQAELGRLLFFDKILSGNKNISCATCHHPLTFSTDRLSLGVGEGGQGLGASRTTGPNWNPIHERVPRNSPALFNIGAAEYIVFFHDGRVRVDPSQKSGFATPAKGLLPMGLESALAAQAMFPVTSPTEMAGQRGENAIANFAARGNLPKLWEALAQRVREIPEYFFYFTEAYGDIQRPQDIQMVHIANALAKFETLAFQSLESPFDHYLSGDASKMSPSELKGMSLFYGKAQCARCHSGLLQTDHNFHSIGLPPIGAGKGSGWNGLDDFGLELTTGDPNHRYKFRTPSLRNVALTGPWGHNGAYNTLKGIIKHHLNPLNGLQTYDPAQTLLPYRQDLSAIDFLLLQHEPTLLAIYQSVDLYPIQLTEEEINNLVAFMGALTDPKSMDLSHLIPMRVPSQLPVFDFQ